MTATCRAGQVRLGAAPSIGWAIDDLDPGPRSEARARFEGVADGDGRVEDRVTCVRGVPHFDVEDDSSGHGSGSSDD